MGRIKPKPSAGLQSTAIWCVVIGLSAFSLGLLNPEEKPLAATAAPVKTMIRVLANGRDSDARRHWVGLSDPSADQAALFAGDVPDNPVETRVAVRFAAGKSY